MFAFQLFPQNWLSGGEELNCVCLLLPLDLLLILFLRVGKTETHEIAFESSLEANDARTY